ncbi:uncharacterized protein LOC128856341 [Anastrepha ludens]|uniref:uncharacterized protein LOC128856341 n=1 Tax=Anastrepha ludens TaxID=28586 RepID=UPI0023AF69E0|nr:uncharacterized protein LOC128856341 [Anastrepha ludens]
MTSSNINKIVRSNIVLKPWILSKNTTEIVNTCIQKIYKQTQNNFKNEPTATSKAAPPKPENKGPLRALRSQERDRVPLSTNTSRTKSGTAASNPKAAGGNVAATTSKNGVVSERLASNAAENGRRSAIANLAAQRKLLKSSPNYKIYSSRRFGSSASSSNASIFRRSDERRRSKTQTAQLNYLLRTYATQLNARNTLSKQSVLPKFMVPARNQHMQSRTLDVTPTHVVHLTSAIQRDLMPIDSEIKDRIALGRPRLSKSSAQKAKSQDPMNGWHHPPSQALFLSHFNQHSKGNAESQEQYSHLKQNSIFDSVDKKSKRQNALDEFVVHVKEVTPRNSPRRVARNQTPNFEQSYLSRAMRQQADEVDAATSAPQPSVDATKAITTTPPAPQLPSVIQSNTVSYSTKPSPQLQPANEERNTTNVLPATLEIPEPMANNTTVKKLTLPALVPPQSETSPPRMPKQVLRITKHSATSQLNKANAAQAAALNQMRFNHSAHLKKF